MPTPTDIIAIVSKALETCEESDLVALQQTLDHLSTACKQRAGQFQAVRERDAGEYVGLPGMFAEDVARRGQNCRDAVERACLTFPAAA
jgi:hypothetical protein